MSTTPALIRTLVSTPHRQRPGRSRPVEAQEREDDHHGDRGYSHRLARSIVRSREGLALAVREGEEVGRPHLQRPTSRRYVHAMTYGVARLSELPLSLRLITEIRRELLTGVRGSHRLPGEFRRSQNWIGPENATLAEATFVPPPVHEMKQIARQL